jgi:hypothetical protein
MIRFPNFLVGVSLIFFFNSTAHAGGESYDLKENKPLSGLSLMGQSDTFSFFAQDFKSYCCEIWSNISDSSGVRFDTITSSEPTAFTSAARGYATPILTRSATNGQQSRQCFYHTATADGRALVDTTIKISIGAGTGSITDGNVRCVETSLYGGFNTVVTDFNFIEISNTLGADVNDNGDVNVVVKGFGISGSEVLTSSFTLAAGKRQDVDVHSSAPSDFGPVVIYHDGPPGAIRAVNAQYRILTQSPLNFEPVLVVPFREGRE